MRGVMVFRHKARKGQGGAYTLSRVLQPAVLQPAVPATTSLEYRGGIRFLKSLGVSTVLGQWQSRNLNVATWLRVWSPGGDIVI